MSRGRRNIHTGTAADRAAERWGRDGTFAWKNFGEGERRWRHWLWWNNLKWYAEGILAGFLLIVIGFIFGMWWAW